ncbi:hypothetical protein [Agrobacterium vitis]|uniref:hypothetical protein n=1 Tax=Agrobacterium vitis TaxID=373 RepID=UPI000871B9B1|nr:hypothetical protein [Agrobacterium vitis]MUO72917.1 hypothetical protein [Agrobacterium vitis]
MYQLTRFIVEGAYAKVLTSRLSERPDPADVQRDLYEKVIERALQKMGPEAAALRPAMATPNFPDFASGLWLDDGFIMPIVTGYAEHLGRELGMLPPDRPIFSVSFARGGWFDVRFSRAEIYSTQEMKKATAVAYGQLVAHSTREIFRDGDCLSIGLENAWKLAAG